MEEFILFLYFYYVKRLNCLEDNLIYTINFLMNLTYDSKISHIF